MRKQLMASLAVVAVLVGLVGPVAAGRWEDAEAAYAREDYPTAFRLWRPLAEQGSARAQFKLGYMYAFGQGVPQDYSQANLWYRRAAEQGNVDAQHNLGVMYQFGVGVPEDPSEAMKWFRMGAAQGDASAQMSLGAQYLFGSLVPQNYVQAHKWFNLAAANYSASEVDDRRIAAEMGARVAAKMTPEQIAEAQRLAREWKPKGDAAAQ